MAEITAQTVNQLRQRTGLGLMECKALLKEADGDLARAETLAKEKGQVKASGRAGRATNAGRVEAAFAADSRAGALIELSCETDFVARNDAFRELARNVAMQVASMNPKYLSKEDVPADEVAPPEDVALLEMAFVREPSKTIQDLVNDVRVKTGENVRIRRFAAPDGEIIRISETTLEPARQLASVAYTVLELRRDGTYGRLAETQVNRFFLVQEMAGWLRAAGFEPLEWFDGFRDERRIGSEAWHVVGVARAGAENSAR